MDEIKHREQVDLIREVFYYQNRLCRQNDRIEDRLSDPERFHFPQLLKDLAMLRATGIEIILIPGAREWIDAVLKEYDIESEYVRRCSDRDAGFDSVYSNGGLRCRPTA